MSYGNDSQSWHELKNSMIGPKINRLTLPIQFEVIMMGPCDNDKYFWKCFMKIKSIMNLKKLHTIQPAYYASIVNKANFRVWVCTQESILTSKPNLA